MTDGQTDGRTGGRWSVGGVLLVDDTSLNVVDKLTEAGTLTCVVMPAASRQFV